MSRAIVERERDPVRRANTLCQVVGLVAFASCLVVAAWAASGASDDVRSVVWAVLFGAGTICLVVAGMAAVIVRTLGRRE
jgi:heme/copper-type cytochrome/quinol oxidase subunit 2